MIPKAENCIVKIEEQNYDVKVFGEYSLSTGFKIAGFLQFRNLARRNLLSRFDQNFARLGVNQVVVKL